MGHELYPELYGWWRILETSQWVNEGLDALGPAILSMTGRGDRLRMHCFPILRTTETNGAAEQGE
jgi:hypothetical protein